MHYYAGMKHFILALLLLLPLAAPAATKNILVTGYWSPTNEMLRRLSPSPVQNPEGWLGKNWRGSGFDVYAYFPEFPEGSGIVGEGDFRVDYASTFNDFMKFTAELAPIAIVSFGEGEGPWEIEGIYPNEYLDLFRHGIPSEVGERVRYAVPASLKQDVPYYSTLSMVEIAAAVNNIPNGPRAWIDDSGGLGGYLCGFLGYLGAWYRAKHSDPADPKFAAMSGFIHVKSDLNGARAAAEATLEVVVKNLPRN